MHLNRPRAPRVFLAFAAGLLLSVACGSSETSGDSSASAGTAGSAAATSGGSAGSKAGAAGALSEAEAGGAAEASAGGAGETAEGGAAGAVSDPELESPEEQQAIIDRTRALAEPSGADPTADQVVLRVTGSDDDGAGSAGAPNGPTAYYECAQQAAAQAYPARRTGQAICRHQPSEGSATNKLLLADATDDLLIAFAGTQLSLSDPSDVGRDFESQLVIAHENPLFEHSDVIASLLPKDLAANSGGSVGRGWEARWRSQLKEANAGNLYTILKRLSSDEIYAAGAKRTLVVTVVGHSLGAVVAELAAYDIYDYLRAKGTRFEVRVIAFNPPKVGSSAFVDGYRYRLLNSAAQRSFEISQFSRSYDPVPKVPLFLSHPVWNTENGSHVIGDGSDQKLPYCPQYALDVLHLPLAAHSIEGWGADIPAMPSDAQCLFGSQLSADDF